MKAIEVLSVGLLAFTAGWASPLWAQEGPSLVARGQDSFQDRCTHCHPASNALRVAKGQEGWRRTLARMSDRHRRVFDEEILADEQSAIVAYLRATAGPNTEW